MGNTMGVPEELGHLSKTDRPGVELPSEAHQSRDIASEDVQPIDTEPDNVQNDANNPDVNLVEVSDDALARDDDAGLTGTKWKKDPIPGADWNRDTEEPIQPS